MQRQRSSWTSRIAPALLALGLIGSACPAARAQDEPAADGDSKGRPLDGYFGAGILAGLAMFLVGKSARR
ncbi:hypothetical protein [Aquisphaera giovannonii]|uniref:hypothetical protein n=1 Tax=Aquisphaera giovannonii TaxID=406548 RepID=UPI0011DF0ED9|nr:hypothetical protein [Aquisphaera giovannonii]